MLERHIDSGCRGDRGRHPGAARERRPVRRHRRRRRRQGAAVPGEAGGPARPAGRPGRQLRLDGQLHLHHRGAGRGAARRRRGPDLGARHGRLDHAVDGRARAGVGLRLRRQRRARLGRSATAATGATSGRWTPTTTPTWTWSASTRSSTSTTSRGRSTPTTSSCRRPSSSTAAWPRSPSSAPASIISGSHRAQQRALAQRQDPQRRLRRGLGDHGQRGDRRGRGGPPGDPGQERGGRARRPHRRRPRARPARTSTSPKAAWWCSARPSGSSTEAAGRQVAKPAQ